MSYTALYRKFRPDNFDDVKGQEHIVETLRNQIKLERIGHAYLFCGTRGTGKTTVAKIFAKAVNCLNPQNGNPCGECEMCVSIQAQNSLNVIEIDAASNNHVEDVRQIREEVAYSPTEGKYKVYIIDEVHMLSTGAFNALLKTLEEPPSYVIFILATTESHKIPITILSRCQKYDFRRITIQTISDRLSDLMVAEGQEVEEQAIRYIARAADGSMRDALSILDQCIAFYIGQKLTYENVLEVLGATDTEVFSEMLELVLEKNVASLMERINSLVMHGRELSQFVLDFTWYLRNLLLIQGADNMEDVIDASTEQLTRLKEQAAQIDAEVLMQYIRIFSDLSGQLRYATQKRILVEMIFVKLCKPEMRQDYSSLVERIERLEEKVENHAPVSADIINELKQSIVASAGNNISVQSQAQPKSKPEYPKAIPEEVRAVVKNWKQVEGKLTGRAKAQMKDVLLSLGGDNQLMLVFQNPTSLEYFKEEENRTALEDVIAQVSGRQIRVVVQENSTGRPSEETFPDISRLINMDIEFE